MTNLSYKTQDYEVQYQGDSATLLGVMFLLGAGYVAGKAIEASLHRTAYLESQAPKYYLNGQENSVAKGGTPDGTVNS